MYEPLEDEFPQRGDPHQRMFCLIVFSCAMHRPRISSPGLPGSIRKAGAEPGSRRPLAALPRRGSSSTDYTRSVRWPNEKVVIHREPFVKWIFCSLPSLVRASSSSLVYSSRSTREWKGTFPLHAHRFHARGRRAHSLTARRRERVVNGGVRPVNAHEERMREACYARCGERERRL